MTQFVIVVGSYKGVIGPFSSLDEAEKFRLSHDFGPYSAQTFALYNPPALDVRGGGWPSKVLSRIEASIPQLTDEHILVSKTQWYDFLRATGGHNSKFSSCPIHDVIVGNVLYVVAKFNTNQSESTSIC